MSFFTKTDHNAVLAFEMANPGATTDVERAHQRMMFLARNLSRKLKLGNIPLYLYDAVTGGISQETVTTAIPQHVMTMRFTRHVNSMQTIESNMGQDGLHSATELKARRHPIIELRLAPDHFAVELIVAPDARYDQQNLAGKLTVQEQRVTLYELLQKVEKDHCVGFWSGIHTQDVHLSTAKLPPFYLLSEFITTFAAGRDYFRAGTWYDVEDAALAEDTIVDELFKVISELYTLYDYLLWTSDNNYHKFYRKAHKMLN